MKKKLGKATGKKLPSRKKQEPNTPAPKFTEIKDPGMITQILALFGTAGGWPFDVPKGTKWVDIYARLGMAAG